MKKDLSPKELAEMAKSNKALIGTPLLNIRGQAVIRDKDGNIKGEMKIYDIKDEEK